MSHYLAVKSMNYHTTIVGKYETYLEARNRVDLAVAAHRGTYGDDNTVSRVENSASKYPYKVEITEMTHEAGLIKDIYYVEKWNDDELPY